MKWRKWNRWLHREIGYLFFGMAIIYGLSGIALNHHIARHWNASLIERTETLSGVKPVLKDNVTKEYVQNILTIAKENENYKQYFFPDEKSMLIYLNKGHIAVNLETGESSLIKISNRKIFREMNFLHYNKPKQLWTYFSDLFAASLIILAISGLFMVRGRKGIKGQGAILVLIGITIPLLFLIIYLWT